MRLKNVLLIGGKGSALGTALHERLCTDSYRIISTVHTQPLLEASYHDRAPVYQVDIRNEHEVCSLVTEVSSRYGEIDILINNASVLAGGLVPTLKTTDWQQVIQTDLTGVFFCCKYVSHQMIRQRNGKILNISSMLGISGYPGQANYSAAKAGVIALTKSLAVELAPYNILVNAICPGFFPSKLNHGSPRAKELADSHSLLDTQHNLADAANFIVFLCTDALRGVTGQIFTIDSRMH